MAEITPISNHRNQLLSLPGEAVYDYISVDYSLPDGYTQLEYIESSGGRYVTIESPGIFSSDAHVDLDFTPTSWGAGSQPTFMSYYGIQAFCSSDNRRFAVWSRGGQIFSSIYGALNQRYQVKYGVTASNTLYFQIDDNAALSVSGSENTSINISIGAYHSGGYPMNMRIYRCTITVDDNIYRDLIPVRRNSDNTLGLYDKVTGSFYTGTVGSWIAGPIIVYKFHKEGQYDYWMKVTQKTPLYDDNGDFYDFSVTGPCIYKDNVTGSINVGIQTISNVLSRKTHLAQDNFDSISVSNDHNSILYSITSNFQTSISSTTTLTYIENHRNQLLSLPGELVYDCIGVNYSLPAGYTQLEYIQSSSDAYINLNQMMTPDTGIMVDCQITSYPDTSTHYPIWCMYQGSQYYELFVKNQYISVVRWGDSSEIYLPTSSNTLIGIDRHVINAYQAVYKKDGIVIHTGVRNNVSTSIQPIILFGYIISSGTSSGDLDPRHPTGKLYGARLYGDRDVNLVPVRRNSDSVLGLLDTVSNTFYPGSGTWTAGSTFSSPIYKFHKEGQYDYWMKVTQKTPLYDETGNFYDFNITGLSIYKEITGPNMDVGIRTIPNILSKKTHLAQDNFDSIAVTNEYNEILHSMANLI